MSHARLVTYQTTGIVHKTSRKTRDTQNKASVGIQPFIVRLTAVMPAMPIVHLVGSDLKAWMETHVKRLPKTSDVLIRKDSNNPRHWLMEPGSIKPRDLVSLRLVLIILTIFRNTTEIFMARLTFLLISHTYVLPGNLSAQARVSMSLL